MPPSPTNKLWNLCASIYITTNNLKEEEMNTFLIACEYVDRLLEEKKDETYRYASVVGTLQVRLGTILWEIQYYHPETYKKILETLKSDIKIKE